VNRKVLALSVSSIIAAVVLSAAGYHFFMQPQAQTETPPVVEKPKFHPFDPELKASGDMKVIFNVQNLGNATANQVNVTITVNWRHSQAAINWNFSQGASPYTPSGSLGDIDDDGTIEWNEQFPIFSLTFSTLIQKIEAKEINEYSAFLMTGQRVGGYSSEIINWIESYDFNITCIENVTETLTIKV